MTLNQVLDMHKQGAIATHEAACCILQYTTTENRDEILAELKEDHWLETEVKNLVEKWRNLTDEQWASFRTVQIGMVANWTQKDQDERDARHKQEHRDIRRGVEALQ